MANEVPIQMLRNSERKSYLTCRQQWWWGYVDCLEGNAVGPALRFGGLAHMSLAEWYIPGLQRGVPPWRTFERLLTEEEERSGERFTLRGEEEGDGRVSAMELGMGMLRHYVEVYGKDEHIEVIAPEMSFQVPAVDSFGAPVYVRDRAGHRKRLVHVGTGDLVFRDMERRQIGVLETKTAASIDVSHLGMDDQAGTYWVLVPAYLRSRGILKKGEDIDFIQYNYLRKALKDTRPVNSLGQRLNKPTAKEKKEFGEKYPGSPSKNQPPDYFKRHRVWRGPSDRNNLLVRMNNIANEMSIVKQRRLPVYKNPSSTWPDQHCRGCEFRDMCMLHETGNDWKAYAQQMMHKWDPYKEHK